MKTGCTVHVHVQATRFVKTLTVHTINPSFPSIYLYTMYVLVHCTFHVQLSMLYLHVHLNMYVLSDTNKTQISPMPVLFLDLFKTLKLYRL